MDMEAIILSFSYLGIFGLMVTNGFLSFFPSSQILYIIVGYFVGTGYLTILPASFLGALGNTIGNVLLYEAVRKHGRHYVDKWKLFPESEVKKVEIVFKKRGLWFLFIGKLLPAIKVFIPLVAALGKADRRAFASAMFISSWIWSFMFISIGYFFGKSTTVWKSYGVILSLIAFTVLFLFYRLMNSRAVTAELLDTSKEARHVHAKE